MISETAHITITGESIQASLSSGELFIRTLDEIIALLRSRNIAAGDVTMPHKDDDESPSTGQRIDLLSRLLR